MPRGLGQLTLLHTLTDFLLPGMVPVQKNCSGFGELNRLSKLRGSLRIEVKGKMEDVVAESNAANLKEKDSFVSLVLVFAEKESDEILLKELQPSLNLRSLEIRGYGSARFPSWISRMVKLVELRLFDCAGCKNLQPLGALTSLKRLEIGALPIMEYTESDLHTLSSLPNLSALRKWESPNLERIPPLLQLKLPSFPLESLQTSVATIEHVIGIDDGVKDVIKLLEIEDDGGKAHGWNRWNCWNWQDNYCEGRGTTDSPPRFDSCSFLLEIGETAQNVGGIQFVQTKLISDILKQDGNIASLKRGIKFFLDVFRSIKVLIVLDDVEEQSHLSDLVGDQL
ncbi:hypothetical protein NL676_007150 [Syzygium grande]|nr:hypothetical protein NL676_007150 [Syzygium grande]